MHRRTRLLARSPRGTSPVEYGLIAAAVVVIVVMVAFAFGSYVHHALRTPCLDGAQVSASSPAACSVEQAR
jgi:Flp pilus assembly pilin Flp